MYIIIPFGICYKYVKLNICLAILWTTNEIKYLQIYSLLFDLNKTEHCPKFLCFYDIKNGFVSIIDFIKNEFIFLLSRNIMIDLCVINIDIINR